jgi:hypothetical protein
MSKVVGWKAWYADGKKYNSDWSALPDDGVIHVAVFLSDKDRFGNYVKRIETGHDWYFSDGDQLFGGNSDSLEENQRRYPHCSFKRGKWVPLPFLGETLKQARNEQWT